MTKINNKENVKTLLDQHLATIQQVKLIRKHLAEKMITLDQALGLLKSI